LQNFSNVIADTSCILVHVVHYDIVGMSAFLSKQGAIMWDSCAAFFGPWSLFMSFVKFETFFGAA